MSDSASTGGPGGYGPAPPPVVTSTAPVWPPSDVPSPATEPSAPWIAIWTRPRATLRHILTTRPHSGLFRLAALGGISGCLLGFVSMGFGDTHSVPVVLSLAVPSGAAGGLVGLFLFSALVRLTGRWIGGRGGMTEILAALAWSNVPSAWSLLLWLPRAALLGGETFHSMPLSLEGNPPAALLYAVLQGIQAMIGVWGFVIQLKCIGEAHQFSAWRALGALLLAGAVLILPVCALAVLVVALQGS